MHIVDDTPFLKLLCGNKTPEELGIMSLNDINSQINGYMPPFSKRGSEVDEFTILSVNDISDFEGIVKIVSLRIIPPGKKLLERARNHIVVCDIHPRVLVPIVLKIQEELYFLLASQKRVSLGGRHTIEVYRGSVLDNVTPNNYAKSLVERKLNSIDELFDLIEVRNLGVFWNNSGNSGTETPIQALFYVAKKNIGLEEVKKSLKVDMKYEADPVSGPPLPLTSPVLRSFDEVIKRLTEISSLDTSSEAYLNDLFSYTALTSLKESIERSGLPY